MKNEGKRFEEDFSTSIMKENIFIYRLRDSSSGWNNGEKGRFTTKNIADFISHNPLNGNIVLLECKSFKGKSCPFSNITPYQIKGMYSYKKEYKGVQAYFIFNFRELEQTYAVDVEKIKELFESETRKSVSLQFCIDNGYLIRQEKKKVRYNYNIEDLFKIA